MATSALIPVMLATPVAGSLLIALLGRDRPKVGYALALASSLIVFVANTWALVACLVQGRTVGLTYEAIGSGPTAALAVRLTAYPLGLVLATLASTLWIATVVYSIGYMEHEHAVGRYLVFLTLAQAATMGIAYSADLLTFFVFYELLTVSVYPLVVHEQSPEAFSGGRTYLIYLLVSESFVFAALFLIWGFAGYVPAFVAGGLSSGAGITGAAALALAVIGFIGFSAKAAVMPMHGWLPEAMVAPTPISAVLHAVAVVKVGILGIMVLLYLVVGAGPGRALGLDRVLPWVASVTVIGASLIALRQDGIKRRLAYSTVSQLGYMVLGASLLTRTGLLGGVLHMIAHSLMKIVLFFCAGIIITQTGKRRFSEIKGLARTMPVTMACFSVAALGMVGVPPAVGWVSKWTLLQGAFGAGRWELAAVILFSALLNLGYYFPPVMSAYFEHPDGDDASEAGDATGAEGHPAVGSDPASTPAESEPHHVALSGPGRGRWEAPLTMLVPTVAVTLTVIVLGVWPRFPYWLADKAVASVFGVPPGG